MHAQFFRSHAETQTVTKVTGTLHNPMQRKQIADHNRKIELQAEVTWLVVVNAHALYCSKIKDPRLQKMASRANLDKTSD